MRCSVSGNFAKAGAQVNELELACSNTSQENALAPPVPAAERDELDSERRLTSLPELPRLSKNHARRLVCAKPIKSRQALYTTNVASPPGARGTFDAGSRSRVQRFVMDRSHTTERQRPWGKSLKPALPEIRLAACKTLARKA